MLNAPPATAPRWIDLHCHSTVSDGTLTPTAVVELAASNGLFAIALTDHDHLGGSAEARAAGARLGVEVVTGVELSTELSDHKGDIHLLGYLVDASNAKLAERLQRFRDVRARRGDLIVDKLRALGVDITKEDVARAAGPGVGSMGRPHIARALVEKGIVASVKDAFDQWLSDDGPAYVEKEKLDARDAVKLVHDAGGVAVLAHPGLLPEASRTAVIHLLAEAGLDGIEVDHSRHTDVMRASLSALAKQLGLLTTGGSDFHGENKPDVALGSGVNSNVRVTMATLDALRQRAALRR